MITMGTYNFAVSLPIHSAGFSLLSTNDYSLTTAVKIQNKPNLPEDQMNVTAVLTKDYPNFRPATNRKNKPNLEPTTLEPPSRLKMQNKPNLINTEINTSTYGYRGYMNIRLAQPRKNKPNFERTVFGWYWQQLMLLALLIRTSVLQKEIDLADACYYNLAALLLSLPRMGSMILY